METVRDNLPEGNFDNMILMLKKFLGFMNLTVSKESSFISFCIFDLPFRFSPQNTT